MIHIRSFLCLAGLLLLVVGGDTCANLIEQHPVVRIVGSPLGNLCLELRFENKADECPPPAEPAGL